jgi:UDP-glucuronate 4-epimerase
MQYIEHLERCLDKTARKNLLPLQPGDVPDTYADVEDLVRDIGYQPTTPVAVGVQRSVEWYRTYYRV